MKKNNCSFILILAILIFYSCENNEQENETNISHYNDNESHKMGQNCMNCHAYGGKGEGWFTTAGTVYDSTQNNTYPNATVKIYTESGTSGNLIHSVEVDGNGNFYTTEPINFNNGLFVSVEGNENTEHMSSPIRTGECNNCHGVSTKKIWAK